MAQGSRPPQAQQLPTPGPVATQPHGRAHPRSSSRPPQAQQPPTPGPAASHSGPHGVPTLPELRLVPKERLGPLRPGQATNENVAYGEGRGMEGFPATDQGATMMHSSLWSRHQTLEDSLESHTSQVLHPAREHDCEEPKAAVSRGYHGEPSTACLRGHSTRPLPTLVYPAEAVGMQNSPSWPLCTGTQLCAHTAANGALGTRKALYRNPTTEDARATWRLIHRKSTLQTMSWAGCSCTVHQEPAEGAHRLPRTTQHTAAGQGAPGTRRIQDNEGSGSQSSG